MLRKLWHWVKTGETLPQTFAFKDELDGYVTIDQPSLYTIQVKENLINGLWNWRLLKNGSSFAYQRIYTKGSQLTKRGAIARGKVAIQEIENHERQKEQKWEDA